MPAYGHQIAHYDRWHVVNYVRQLQGLLEVESEGEAEEDEWGGGSGGQCGCERRDRGDELTHGAPLDPAARSRSAI